MKNKIHIKLLFLYVIVVLVLSGCSVNLDKNFGLDPKNPISIEIWHYYNGLQKIAFDKMTMEFNETVGLEKGIIVEAFSQGNIDDLQTKIMDSINKKVGSSEIPNVFTAYADTAYVVDELGLATDFDDYMTDEELEEYIDSYIEEGRFYEGSGLKIFPIAKATEIMMVNKTDWNKFAHATGVTIDKLETWEGLALVAQSYYEWTDSLTDSPNDGKAFFGRDAMANYILVGSKQLGKEIFTVENGQFTLEIDDNIMRRIWDNFYTPYIKGYYGAFGQFRSDDARIGEIIALVGSTTGAAYFPDNVTTGENVSYDIESIMLPVPNFENTTPCAIQQGAGMVVLKSDKAHEYASVEFLKWFTQGERNIEFSMQSGYLPVKKSMNNIELIEKKLADNTNVQLPDQLRTSLPIAIWQINRYELYTSKAYTNGTKVRNIITNSLIDKAKTDRAYVIELIHSGKPLDVATTQFTTDENFNTWLEDFKSSLEAATIK